MSTKQRELLLRINEQIKKLSTPPPTTFAPSTGSLPTPIVYQSGTTPTPIPPVTVRPR